MIKAAMLKTSDEVDFMAFFDLDGCIPDEDSAMHFLHNLRLLTTFPVSLSFRLDGKWRHLASDADLTRFMMRLGDEVRDGILLYVPVVRIPGNSQSLGGRTNEILKS